MDQQKTNIKPEFEEELGISLACRVVLYNDDWHTFDEVINQIIKATKCPFEQARTLTFEVHVKGKAIVHSGDIKECLEVSSVLQEIGLHTQIVTD